MQLSSFTTRNRTDNVAKYKYLNKHYFNLINHIARDVIKYNRSLPQEVIDALPEDKFFPIIWSMVHEHIAGAKVEPHMRCMIVVPEKPNSDESFDRVIVDVEMGLFDMLPEMEVPDRSEAVSV